MKTLRQIDAKIAELMHELSVLQNSLISVAPTELIVVIQRIEKIETQLETFQWLIKD